MMRNVWGMLAVACATVTGCGTSVSTIPLEQQSALPNSAGGVTYSLPKGTVPIRVFVDANGVGISVEPAHNIVDSKAGPLLAQLQPSPFNKESMSLVADANGFLSTLTSQSEAKLLEIFQEGAKSIARIALQAAQAEAAQGSVTVLQRDFDPLSAADLLSLNNGIAAALARGTNAAGHAVETSRVTVQVDPKAPEAQPQPDLRKCRAGICVRVMTTRRISLLLNGEEFASKVVNVPSWQVVSIPMPQSILSDQTLNVTVTEGVLTRYDLARDSEALAFVKIPGMILSGAVAGFTQGITDSKTATDKQKELLVAQKDLVNAEKDLFNARKQFQNKENLPDASTITIPNRVSPVHITADTIPVPPSRPPVVPNPSTPSAEALAYRKATLVVYPYSTALKNAVGRLPK